MISLSEKLDYDTRRYIIDVLQEINDDTSLAKRIGIGRKDIVPYDEQIQDQKFFSLLLARIVEDTLFDEDLLYIKNLLAEYRMVYIDEDLSWGDYYEQSGRSVGNNIGNEARTRVRDKIEEIRKYEEIIEKEYGAYIKGLQSRLRELYEQNHPELFEEFDED